MAPPTDGDGDGAPASPAPDSPEDRVVRQAGEQPHEGTRRSWSSWLIDAAVALVLLIADAVIVVGAVLMLFMIGMSRSEPSATPERTGFQDTPVLGWLVIWGLPAVAAAGAFIHARLRMPITAIVQTLFTLACTLLAVIGTRMLLGR